MYEIQPTHQMVTSQYLKSSEWQSNIFQTRQNDLQNNWLLRAYKANIHEKEQHLQSIQGIILHKKGCLSAGLKLSPFGGFWSETDT